MIQDKTQLKKAILISVQLPKETDAEIEASLQELHRLVQTLGYQVIGQLSQKRNSQKSATLLGDGKLRALAKWTGGTGVIASAVEHKKSKAALKWEAEALQKVEVDENELLDASDDIDDQNPTEKADIVIADCDLSPSQLRNLESATGAPVLDRTGVIIEIFSRHARTKSARLQVEIARLTYVAPRLRETGGATERSGGGVGGKGSGETALELDKRKIRDRIKELKIELTAVGNEDDVRRAKRNNERTVALVGYTNAGKSSLMRALTGSEVLVADKLFATLDTTIRPLHPESVPKVLISDTVGFIKKLPHDLVASFKSTLDEALHASLLLFVVDSSDPSFRSQLQVTYDVLGEVGATEVPRLLILNKIDNLTVEEIVRLRTEYPEAVMLSTRSKENVFNLRNQILAYFETDMIEGDVEIPYAVKGLIGEIRAKSKVIAENYNENGVILKIKASENFWSWINKKKNERTFEDE